MAASPQSEFSWSGLSPREKAWGIEFTKRQTESEDKSGSGCRKMLQTPTLEAAVDAQE
jgi:hypothetical protein